MKPRKWVLIAGIVFLLLIGALHLLTGILEKNQDSKNF